MRMRCFWSTVLVCTTLLLAHRAFAQFSQQGPKLVGTGAVGNATQGRSVSISGDGNTAIVGGPQDNFSPPDFSAVGAAWIWARSGGIWTQQGPKLVGSDAAGNADQGTSVAISADGNTAIVGGLFDANGVGAAWIWTKTGNAWTQQGPKLVGSDIVKGAREGISVALSADGNTAIVGGFEDADNAGAVWVWTRSGGVWNQQGPKLVGSGASFPANQGASVALSADGNTAIVGGPADGDFGTGATWVWTRSGGAWTQQGPKLVSSDGTNSAREGSLVTTSADGNTAIIGGNDGPGVSALWSWTRSGGVWTQQGPKQVVPGVTASLSLSADGSMVLIGLPGDNGSVGSVSVWTRSGGGWTQQGSKLTGWDAVGTALQGESVALSGDGTTIIFGGSGDNASAGAAWAFTAFPIPAVSQWALIALAGFLALLGVERLKL